MKPDGEACRKDGTLKNADEMEWPKSTSEDVPHAKMSTGRWKWKWE